MGESKSDPGHNCPLLSSLGDPVSTDSEGIFLIKL